MTKLERRAYRLGSVDAYAGNPPLDATGEESDVLMSELGQTSATTAANWDRRLRACHAYLDGWHDARSAMS